MTVPISTRRWRSIASPSAFALELTARPLDPSALRQFLASLPEKELRDAAFVVVRLRALERERSKPIVVAANTWSHSARLCLAVDRGTLERIDFSALVAEHVGLILDDVDAETPLSAIARDSVEAIRFGAEFVARARGTVRVGCVLATMLDLASNLGLVHPLALQRPQTMSRRTHPFRTLTSCPLQASTPALTSPMGGIDACLRMR